MGLLLITLIESDLSLLSVAVTDSVKKCVCIYSVKIKPLNIETKFSGHF